MTSTGNPVRSRVSRQRRVQRIASAAIFSATATWAHADPTTGLWLPVTNGNYNWEDPANWVAGVVPGVASAGHTGVDDLANLSVGGSFNTGSVKLNNVPVTLGELDLGRPGNASGYSVSGTNQLTFQASSGTAYLRAGAGGLVTSSEVTVGKLMLASDLVIDTAANAHLSLYSPVSDDGGFRSLTISGAGTTTIGSYILTPFANTYGGTTRVVGGTLELGGNPSYVAVPSSLVIGTDAGTAATVRLLGNNRTPANTALTINSGASFDLNAWADTVSTLTGGGNVALGNNPSNGFGLTVSGSNDCTFAGNVTGIGLITRAGTGTLTVTGNSTFPGNLSGGFALKGGTLAIGAPHALGAGNVVISDDANASTLTSAFGPLTVTNGVQITHYANFGGSNAMTFGSLIFNSTSSVQINTLVDAAFAGGLIAYNGNPNATKVGPGTLTVTVAPNTQASPGGFFGTWTVNQGTLRVLNPLNAIAGAQRYTLNNATLDLTGAPSFSTTLYGANATVLGSITLTGSMTGTNLTLGDVSLPASGAGALNGSFTVGKLTVDGFHLFPSGSTLGGASPVLVNPAATLRVVGEIDKPINVAGTLSGPGLITGPVTLTGGTSAATLTPSATLRTGTLTFGANSQFQTTVNGATATSVAVTGAVDLTGGGAGASLAFNSYYFATTPVGTNFVLISNDGTDPVVGQFAGLPDSQPFTIYGTTNYLISVNYHYDAAGDGGNNDVALTYVGVAPAPEPAAVTGLAFAGLAALARRRRRPGCPPRA